MTKGALKPIIDLDADRYVYLARLNGKDEWCLVVRSTGLHKALPAWWSPDRQTAWRIILDDESVDDTTVYESKEAAEDDCDGFAPRPTPVRITCDLITGGEIPA